MPDTSHLPTPDDPDFQAWITGKLVDVPPVEPVPEPEEPEQVAY